MTFLEGRRFYATILSKMVKIPTPTVPTLGVGFNTNGKLALYYNEDFFLTKPLAQAQALLEHEVLHIFWRHLIRHPKNGDQWLDKIKNLGCDCAINQYLKNLPEGGVYPKTFDMEEEKNADYYIEELKKKMPKQNSCPQCGQPMQGKQNKKQQGQDQQGQDQQGQGKQKNKDQKNQQGQEQESTCPHCGQDLKGQTIDSHDLWGKVIDENTGEMSDVKDHDIDPEFEVQNVVMKAIKECKDFGNLPNFVTKEIELLKKIKRHNWKHELKVFVNSVLSVKKRLSQKRVNRRFADMDYILPGKKKSRRPRLMLVRDTSGSMYDDKIQKELVNEMIHISKFSTVLVADCDTKVHQVYEVHSEKDFKKYKGGGGTSFGPAFKEAKKEGVDGIVYLTDTYGDFPEKGEVGKFAAKTIWVTFDQEKVEIPFGKHVNITNERED